MSKFFWLRQILKNVSVCFSSRISILVRLIEMEKEIYGRATLAQQGMPSHSTSVQERIYFWSVLQPTFLQLFPFLRTYVCIYVWTLLLWTFRDLREGDEFVSTWHVAQHGACYMYVYCLLSQPKIFFTISEILLKLRNWNGHSFFSLRFPQFSYITVVLYMTYIKGRGVIEVNVVSGICIEALSDAVTCQ